MKKIIGAAVIFVWVLTTSVIVASLPGVVRIVCINKCGLAEQVAAIVGGPSGQIEAQLGQLFTSAEVSHLTDVSRLLWVIKAVWVILSLALISNIGTFRKSLDWGIKLTLILLVATSATVLAAWRYFFVGFHQLFFPQGNWAFPADSYLLEIYPEPFWQRMTGLMVL